MTRLLNKNSNLKVLSRIIKSACADNNVNACRVSAVCMDVISGGARGAEAPPIILMIQKFFM